MPDLVTQQETELDQLKARRDALSSELGNQRLERFIPMITRKGKLKGEIAHLTPGQFEKFTGAKPRQSIIIDGKIPWELALDTIATEAGYKSDEEFRDAVLQFKDSKGELDDINRDINIKKQQIKDTKKSIPKIEHTRLDGQPPIYPKQGTSPEIVTEVNGITLKQRRNPSFWQVEADVDGDGKPDTVARVRYSQQAKQLANQAAKGHQQDIMKVRRLGKKFPRITPKKPKLR